MRYKKLGPAVSEQQDPLVLVTAADAFAAVAAAAIPITSATATATSGFAEVVVLVESTHETSFHLKVIPPTPCW